MHVFCFQCFAIIWNNYFGHAWAEITKSRRIVWDVIYQKISLQSKDDINNYHLVFFMHLPSANRTKSLPPTKKTQVSKNSRPPSSRRNKQQHNEHTGRRDSRRSVVLPLALGRCQVSNSEVPRACRKPWRNNGNRIWRRQQSKRRRR